MTTTTHTINYETLEARALVRSVFTLAQQGELDYDRAAQVLCACGIPTTSDQVDQAVEWMDAVAHPDVAIERGVEVPGRADTHQQARFAVRGAAQYDLDELVAKIANGSRPVSLTSAVLDLLTVMTVAA